MPNLVVNWVLQTVSKVKLAKPKLFHENYGELIMTTRKILTNAAVALSALGLTSMAFANGGTFAPEPGPMPQAQPQSAFYIGASAGWGDTHWDNIFDATRTITNFGGFAGANLTTTLNSKDTGFAGRAFVGYDFNKYLAIEGGWTYLPTSKVDGSMTISNILVPGVTTGSGSFKIKNYAFDLMGKVTAPLGDGLSIYAKAGVNYFRSKISSTSGAFTGATFDNGKSKADHWGPVFGVGAQYEIFTNLFVNVDWMRFSGDGQVQPKLVQTGTNLPDVIINGKYQPNPDVIMGGLTYKFPVDLG